MRTSAGPSRRPSRRQRHLRRRAGRLGGDGGSTTLELAILAPGLLALLGLVIVAGRIEAAASAVEQAAASAARAASLARDARSAASQATAVAQRSLADQGLRCGGLSVDAGTAGFAVAVGTAASVSVAVRCTVPLADVAVPGLPGSRTVSAEATSPLDRFRGRS